MKKKILVVILLILSLSFSAGCGRIQMPFNGDITFHKISLTVPERFIRDSTQSTEDVWVFEHNNYSEYILISRKDIDGDASAWLNAHVRYMEGNGANSEIVSFLNGDAVVSTYYLDDVFCQEVVFPYDNSFYAVALRGGTENGFREITATIKLMQNVEL